MKISALEIEKIAFNPYDPELICEWESIQNTNPFMSIQWLQSLKKSLGPTFPIKYSLKIKSDNKTIGLIPISLNKEKILGPISILSYTIMHSHVGTPDHLNLHVLPEYYKESLTAIFNWLKKQKTSVWFFKDFAFESKFYQDLERACQQNGKLVLTPDAECPYLDLTKIPDLGDWLKKKFKPHVRKRRKLLREHHVECHNVQNTSELDKVLNYYLTFHKKKWGLKSPIIQCEKNFLLLKKFCEKMLSLNKLRMFYILVDGEFGAVDISFVGGKTQYQYQAAHNDKFDSYSIGNICRICILENAFNSGLEKFDFLRGEEIYKKKLTEDIAFNKNLMVFKKDIFGLTLYNAIKLKNFLKK